MGDNTKSWHQRLYDKFVGVLNANKDRLNTEMYLGDSQARDAFGRLRVSAPFGVFDSKTLSGTDTAQWQERLTGAIIEHGTVTGGPFQVGETITGGTSGKTGTVTAVKAGNVVYDTKNNDFEDGETITGGTSGATATVTSHDTGADITYQYNRASTHLSLGTASGQKVISQSIRYFSYVPGFSQQIFTTGVMEEAKESLKQTIGCIDDYDGLAFVLDGLTPKVLRRTSTSGTPADFPISRDDWNIDKLDGTGPSGYTLDLTKSQIDSIDFEWLGVGRIRYALNINGQNFTIHEIDNANETAGVYMRTPTLPIRYEIENTGETTSASTLEKICSTVISEGGYLLPGLEFSAGHTYAQERDITTRAPIFAIRLKNEFPTGKPNRHEVRFLRSAFSAAGNDARFELVHVHVPNSATATWTSVSPESCVEFSTDISVLNADVQHIVEVEPSLPSGQAGKGGSSDLTAQFVNKHSILSQNFESDNSQMFVVFATPRTGTASVMCSITWIESE